MMENQINIQNYNLVIAYDLLNNKTEIYFNGFKLLSVNSFSFEASTKEFYPNFNINAMLSQIKIIEVLNDSNNKLIITANGQYHNDVKIMIDNQVIGYIQKISFFIDKNLFESEPQISIDFGSIPNFSLDLLEWQKQKLTIDTNYLNIIKKYPIIKYHTLLESYFKDIS